LCYSRGTEAIPAFNERGELPPGVHDTTLQEIEKTLGLNQKRRGMIGRLQKGLLVLDLDREDL
jgi:hypothetical protein